MSAKNTNATAFVTPVLPQLEDLYRTAQFLLDSESDAQDLVRDSLSKAYLSWQKNQFGPNCRVWLFSVMVNAYVEKYRPFPALSSATDNDTEVDGYWVRSLSGDQPTDDDSKQNSPLSLSSAINRAYEVERCWTNSQSVNQPSADNDDRDSAGLSERKHGNDGSDGYWASPLSSNQQPNVGSQEQPPLNLSTAVGGTTESRGYWVQSRPANQEQVEEPRETPGRELSSDNLIRAVKDLPKHIRLIYVLSLLEGFSYQQIADIVGIHLETVRSRLQQGRILMIESFRSGGSERQLSDNCRQSEEN